MWIGRPYAADTVADMPEQLRVAVIGAGYWGPNLARNFNSSPFWDLAAIVDLDASRAQKVANSVGGVAVVTDVEEVLSDNSIDAVAIATPARTHHPLAMRAFAAGKHVVVEKPMADTSERAQEMNAEARRLGLVLMTDHTYCYTTAVEKVRELVVDGYLGDILYIDSTRINLGLVQPDVDVFWDLAPHDLSIIDFIVPGGFVPATVAAYGADPIGAGKSCVGHLMAPLENGGMVHVHVNWMSPTKIRQMVVAGTRRTLVWDDLNPQQRLSVYDRGIDLKHQTGEGDDRVAAMVSYRLGDTWSPALAEREALSAMVQEFATAIRDGRPARTDGDSGLRVLNVLEAASRSLENAAAEAGAAVPAA